jgi:hypothetical protein
MRLLFISLCLFFSSKCIAESQRWSVEKAISWQTKTGWKAGANFVPSTAVNELEMFQAETFDVATIDRELGYAQTLGFSVVRVFLHNLLWSQDSTGFVDRIEKFLDVANNHGISVMFVLFDSCWLPNPVVGTQPPPTPGVHNSQWVQAPGNDTINNRSSFEALEGYVKGVVGHFKNDNRILAWDIWNEPDNSGYADSLIAPLLIQTAKWARDADPTQPLTTPVWTNPSGPTYSTFEQLQMLLSDIISFHSYEDALKTQEAVTSLQAFGGGRPVLCSEYMARSQNSTFEPHMQIMKDSNVIAINWGLVSGKIQTIYPWSTQQVPATEPPEVWFHDILNPDGSAFNSSEVSYIQALTL